MYAINEIFCKSYKIYCLAHGSSQDKFGLVAMAENYLPGALGSCLPQCNFSLKMRSFFQVGIFSSLLSQDRK